MTELVSQDPASSLQWENHPKFYYPDGNICLVAQNTVFKVLKSQLVEVSELFADLFSFAESEAEGQQIYDGVPVIMLDDIPEDLAVLFTFLWRPRFAETQFNELCSLARVSGKYLMTAISEWCLSQLTIMLPDGVHGAAECLEFYRNNSGSCINIIDLARQCDLPQLLPMAFYYVAVKTAEQKKLDLDDLRRVVMAKSRLLETWWDIVRTSREFTLDREPCEKCKRTPEWVIGLPSATPTIDALQTGAADPLRYLEQCKARAAKLFEDLPVLFDL